MKILKVVDLGSVYLYCGICNIGIHKPYVTLDALITTESLGEKKNKPKPQSPPGYEIKSEELLTSILSFKFDASEEVFGSCGCRGDCPTYVPEWKP